MSSNTFPALSINTQSESPLNMLAQITQIRGQQQQQELGSIQLQEARVQQQSRQALMAAWAENGGDMNQTYAAITSGNYAGKVDPNTVINFRTQSVAMQTQAAKLDEAKLANIDKMHDLAANELEGFKALPVEQRTPQAVQEIVGRLGTAGVDVSKIMPTLQSVAQDPSDQNVNRIETAFKGEQWVVDNEIKQRQLASMPTVPQAQAKTQAELDKAITDLNISKQQLANLPSAAQAHNQQMADYRRTLAQTAEAQAKTAESRAQTALLGANPVKAFDPKSGQWYMTTMGQASSSGMTNPIKLDAGQVKEELEATRQFDIMQSSVADYQGSLQRIAAKGLTDRESQQVASLLSDKDIFSGLGEHVLGSAGMGRVNDALTELNKSNVFNNLSPELQDAMTNYIRARAAIPLAQKAISGVGRMSEMAMKLEGAIVPTPLEGPSAATKIQGFQTEISLGSQGLMRIFGVKSPEEIRQASENKSRAQIQSDFAQRRAQQAAIARQQQQPSAFTIPEIGALK